VSSITSRVSPRRCSRALRRTPAPLFGFDLMRTIMAFIDTEAAMRDGGMKRSTRSCSVVPTGRTCDGAGGHPRPSKPVWIVGSTQSGKTHVTRDPGAASME